MTIVAPDSLPRRVLLIKPSSLGDIVHALPVLNLMKRAWPGVHVSWLVMPPFADLLRGHPLVDEVILFERRRLAALWRNPAALLHLFDLTRGLRQRRFDLVVDLQGLFRSGWLTWRTRSRRRVGFANARELAWAFYTHRVPIDTMEQHAVERNLAIAEAIGLGRAPVEFPLPPRDAERARIDELIPASHRCAVLLPAANWQTKRWPAENFRALIGPLRERFGLASVVAGGPDAIDLAGAISPDYNLAGQTTLKESLALLDRADLVIANDTGPMHLAAALGRPLVAIFAPTNPVRTGPYARLDCVVRVDKSCSPCYSRRQSRCDCIAQITPEQVLDAAERQLAAVFRVADPRKISAPSDR